MICMCVYIYISLLKVVDSTKCLSKFIVKLGRWPNHQSACCTNPDSQHPCKKLGKVLICNLRTLGNRWKQFSKAYGRSVYPAKELWDQGKTLTQRITLTTIEKDAWHQPLDTHRGMHVYHIYMHTYKYTLAHVIHTGTHIQRPNIWWDLRNICLCYNHLLTLFCFRWYPTSMKPSVRVQGDTFSALRTVPDPSRNCSPGLSLDMRKK